MYYEKWGFMLIFWNLAGVPLSYCHCTIFLANHAPSVYRWNRFGLAVFYIAYLFVYWVWDTANSQKNCFRHEERGTLTNRKAFPQLPWQRVKNPKTIETEAGDSLLVDGWCKFCFKTELLRSRLTQRQTGMPGRSITPATCISRYRGASSRVSEAHSRGFTLYSLRL